VQRLATPQESATAYVHILQAATSKQRNILVHREEMYAVLKYLRKQPLYRLRSNLRMFIVHIYLSFINFQDICHKK
jgi:hypothetical protein